VFGTLSPVNKIDLYCTLGHYDFQAFRLLVLEAGGYVPCPLCGEIHGVRIHALLWRKVRSAETGENVEIRIVSIICEKAKSQAKQYTKRILPPFVIPFCQIGREGVLGYLRLYPEGRIVYRIALAMLGARDKRTIGRHLAMGLAGIAQAALALAALLAEVPSYATVPKRRVEQWVGEYLEALVQETARAGRRAASGGLRRLGSVVYVHLADLFTDPYKPLVPPLSSVLRAMVFHDTS
jgi:hypothetical protein